MPKLKHPLIVGEEFRTKLGRRRLIRVGDRSFFCYENRRYWCEVLANPIERYVDGWGNIQLRHDLTVKVLEV